MGSARKRCAECRGSLSERDVTNGALLCDACAARIDTMFASLSDDDALNVMNAVSKAWTGKKVVNLPERSGKNFVLECFGGKWDGRKLEIPAAALCSVVHVAIIDEHDGYEGGGPRPCDVYRKTPDGRLVWCGTHDLGRIAKIGKRGGAIICQQSMQGDGPDNSDIPDI